MGIARRAAGLAFLRSIGWRLGGERPAPRKYVVIAAPHTSNWDFPITLGCLAAYDVDVKWVGKHTIFRGPMGPVMKRLGGVPVVRDRSTNFVAQMAGLFEEHDDFALTMATEGTRRRVDFWKSGFYHLARLANVPVVLGYLDYAKKEGGMGPAIELSGDVTADMDRVRAFYDGKVGCRPENFGPIRLRSEVEPEPS
ncbi:MAG: lysophospholipid acyltransferase family protein [Myxococcota bacterium]